MEFGQRAVDLGMVNQAFATSVDVDEGRDHEAAGSSALALSSTVSAGVVVARQEMSRLSQSPGLTRCRSGEFKPSGWLQRPDGELKKSSTFSDMTSFRLRNGPSLSTPHVDYQRDQDDERSFEEGCNDAVTSAAAARFNEHQQHSYADDNASDAMVICNPDVAILQSKQQPDLHEISYGNNFSSSFEDPRGGSEKTGFEDATELAELNVSLRSDCTEFYYTPDISPQASPSRMDLRRLKSDNHVTFDETSIQIAQDSMESYEGAVGFHDSMDDEMLDCIDQEYLRRLVDPTQKFFVCIFQIQLIIKPRLCLLDILQSS